MSKVEFIALVLILALATSITRFIPFLVFDKKEKLPSFIEYLGKVLPAAMMGLLVVYCFKDIEFSDINIVLPLFISSLFIVIIHLWKHNTILSIALGTILYMLLLRLF